MPRPHPPRKRPRRRPAASQRAVRADAALTKQTAESATPKTQVLKASAAAKQAPPDDPRLAPDAMWSRRSYAVFMVCIFGVQVIIGTLLFVLAAPPKDVLGLVGAAAGYLQPLQPVPQLAACLLAAPVAKRISGEVRPLRFMESLAAGVIIYALFFVLAIVASFLLTSVAPGTATSSCGPNGAFPTPLGQNASANPSRAGATPCPSPSPSGAASPSARPSASASAGSSVNTNTGTSAPASAVLGTFVVVDILAYVAAVWVYPAAYRRLRVKPPAPRDRPSGRASK